MADVLCLHACSSLLRTGAAVMCHHPTAELCCVKAGVTYLSGRKDITENDALDKQGNNVMETDWIR